MKKFLLAAAVLLSLATVASAAPLKLTDQQLDQSVAGQGSRTAIINSYNGNNNGNNDTGSDNGNFNGNLNGAHVVIIVRSGRG